MTRLAPASRLRPRTEGSLRMKARAGLLIALVTAVAGCSQTGSTTASHETAPTSSTASNESPLAGEWDTGPYPANQLRAAIIAAGYSEAEAHEVVGDSTQNEFNLTFYTENGVPFVSATGWDPTKGTKPLESDHGPYLLLPGDRLKITCDVCDIDQTYQLYSYRLQGNVLTLHWLHNGRMGAYDRRYALAYALAATFKPLHKVT